MNEKYIVRLSDQERGVCRGMVKRLKGTSEKVRRAQILRAVPRLSKHRPSLNRGAKASGSRDRVEPGRPSH